MLYTRIRRNKNELQAVKLGYKFTEIFGMVFVFGIIGIIALVKPDLLHQNQGSFALTLRFLGFLCLVYSVIMGCSLSRCRVEANATGIEWYAHGQNHKAEWGEIKVIYIRRECNQRRRSRYINLILISPMDEELGNLPLSLGSIEKKQSLLDFITKRVKVVYEDNVCEA